MEKFLLVPMFLFLTGFGEDLTRDEALQKLQASVNGMDFTFSVPLGTVFVETDPNGAYRRLQDFRVVRLSECSPTRDSAWLKCISAITEEGKQFIASQGIPIRKPGYEPDPFYMNKSSNNRVNMKASTFSIQSVTGITDVPGAGPGLKKVYYTYGYSFNLVGTAELDVVKAFYIEKAQPAIFQKYDDGWRLVEGPL